MSELLRAFVGMFAVVAPLGALPVLVAYYRTFEDKAAYPARHLIIGAPLVAFAALVASAAVSGPVLDWLDVTGESFQFAAGAVMFPLAMRLLISGDSMPLPDRLPGYAWLVPFALPMLGGPSSVIAVISYADRFGETEAIAASLAALAITAAVFAAVPLVERWPSIVVSTLGRFSGGVLLVIAVELAIDGVQSV